MVGEEGIEPVRALPRWSYSPLPHLEASLPNLVLADGVEPSATRLSGEALTVRTHERFLSKAFCLSFSFVSSDNTLDFLFFG